MTIYTNAPTNIDVYVNYTSNSGRVWFSDSNGVVLDRVLGTDYDNIATGTEIKLTYHAPGGYKLTLQNKSFSAASPTWSPVCATTVTGGITVPASGVAQVADYNIMICDGTNDSPVAWIDPKWTIKKPGGANLTVQAMSELVRPDQSVTTIAVMGASNGLVAGHLSVPNAAGSSTLGGPLVGSRLVFLPGVPLTTTYNATIALSDPDNLGYEWSTDGRTWTNVSVNPQISQTTGVGATEEVTVQLRYASTGAALPSFDWILDNSTPSALSCQCATG